MLKLFFTAALVCLSLLAAAQFTLHGAVRDSKTNQNLEGATVQVLEPGESVVTDALGRFEITGLSAGPHRITVKFLGYAEKEETINLIQDQELIFLLDEKATLTDEVIISATRADEKTPTTYTNISRKELQTQNFGQDMPFLLNWTPSLVTTSDAGTGIGYTGMRIRGSDATRINVTINGIPYNDAESQGTFWVDIPDIASSTESIQVQRGVGTSTNGGSAFGATVNLQTNTLNEVPYAEAIVGAGSFNTQRYTFRTGTGLINDHWAFDVKASRILSDGYVERAASDLASYYMSGGYYGKNTVVKALTFGGHEITYQSWYGLDEAMLKIDRRFNYAGAVYDSLGNVSYYENQVDDYKQDHYQLHVSQRLNDSWNANLSFHYTYGRGFYEEYHQGDSLKYLGLPDYTIGGTTVEAMDVVVQKWLDNKFYGAAFSLNYEKEKASFVAGGAFNRYGDARHFGKIIWAQFAESIPPDYQYYSGESVKDDFSGYAKLNYAFTSQLNGFVDVQFRYVRYETAGIRDDQSSYSVDENFNFFNPKAGIGYTLSEENLLYASYAIAHREPNRTDYLDGDAQPRPEKLANLEVGLRRNAKSYNVDLNYYLMNYADQLVLTGQLDNVGNPIRANVGESYRTGLEVSAGVKLSNRLVWNANATISLNKNVDYVFADANNDLIKKNTAIVLSPNLIAGSQFVWNTTKNFKAALLSKYVGKQYLNNTENDAFALDAYFINDLRLNYTLGFGNTSSADVSLLVNNIFDVEYSSNGVDYGIPFYFPQSGRNFMVMLSLRF